MGGLAKGTLLARWASKRRVAEDWIRLEAVGIEVKAAGSRRRGQLEEGGRF